MKPRVAITLGDPAGIGPEIVAKAVRDKRVLAVCAPIIVGDPLAFALHRQGLPKVEMLSTPGLNKKIPLGKASAEAGRSAIESLEMGVRLIQSRQATALVTAPVSKEAFHLADHAYPGHTEWLAAKSKASSVGMLMVAGRLRALLLTRHVPLMNVMRHLNRETIREGAALAADFCRRILAIAKPRIVLCGLNPHASDGGLIGKEEGSVFSAALKALSRTKHRVEGPVAADSAFRDMTTGRYDMALCPYHDQGMIALKVFAPDRLVNVTIGLPFIRTSPGHGTAYDIAGRGTANVEPMIEAIRLAAEYASPAMRRTHSL